jgi:hypothetical protein
MLFDPSDRLLVVSVAVPLLFGVAVPSEVLPL